MAFADWEILFTPAGQTASLTATSPLADSSSLEMALSGGSNRAITATSDGVAFTRGIGYGKIRTLIEFRTGTSTVLHQAGLFCLAASATYGSGSGFAWVASLNSSTNEVQLKYTNAVQPNGTSVAAVDVGFVQGTPIALELQWNDDSAGEIGGYHLIVRTGTMLDFSDLTEQINYVDPSKPAVAGYEGLYSGSDSGNTNWIFDNTTVFTIA